MTRATRTTVPVAPLLCLTVLASSCRCRRISIEDTFAGSHMYAMKATFSQTFVQL